MSHKTESIARQQDVLIGKLSRYPNRKYQSNVSGHFLHHMKLKVLYIMQDVLTGKMSDIKMRNIVPMSVDIV